MERTREEAALVAGAGAGCRGHTAPRHFCLGTVSCASVAVVVAFPLQSALVCSALPQGSRALSNARAGGEHTGTVGQRGLNSGVICPALVFLLSTEAQESFGESFKRG